MQLPKGRAAVVVLLVFLSTETCWATGLTNLAVADNADANSSSSSSTDTDTDTGKTTGGQDPHRVALLTSSLLRITLGFLLQLGMWEGSVGVFAVLLYRASHAFDVGPRTCGSRTECLATTALVLLAMAAQGCVYYLVLRPKETAGESAVVKLWRNISTASYTLTSLFHLLALAVLWHVPGSREVSFTITAALTFSLLAVLAMQAAVGVVSGEWTTALQQTYDKGTWYDASISSSMDNLPGMLGASMGLSVLVSQLVLAEALHFEHDEPPGLPTARLIAALLTSIGMFLVAASPLYNKNLEGIVPHETLALWGGMHYKLAVLAFGAMFGFEMLAVRAACGRDGRGCSRMARIGRVVAVFAVLLMGVSLGWPMLAPKSYPPILDATFALGEYMMMATPPMVLLGRYRTPDLRALTRALVLVSKHFLPSEKSALRVAGGLDSLH